MYPPIKIHFSRRSRSYRLDLSTWSVGLVVRRADRLTVRDQEAKLVLRWTQSLSSLPDPVVSLEISETGEAVIDFAKPSPNPVRCKGDMYSLVVATQLLVLVMVLLVGVFVLFPNTIPSKRGSRSPIASLSAS